MKFSTVLSSLLNLAAIFTSAAPLDDSRRNVIRRARQDAAEPYYPSSGYAYPSGIYPTASGYPTSSGVPNPTSTALTNPSAPTNPPAPTSTGTSCSPNGLLICNGLYQWGLCNWGKIVWQTVANGTACVDGAITWVLNYPH